MANVRLSDLQQAVSTIDFPAGKDEIVRTAQQHAAGEEVMRALRSLQPVEYGNAQEVIRSVHVDVGSERVEAVDADPERRSDASGVADRLR